MIKRGICLDLDGTILNSFDEGLKRFCRVAASFGLSSPRELKTQARQLWGTSVTTIIQTLWPKIDANLFCSEWAKIDSSEYIPVVPGAIECLTELRKRFVLSILTNRDRSTTMFQIRPFVHLFSFVLTLDDIKLPKPNPESAEKMIKKYQKMEITPDHIILVGDTVDADLTLARSINVHFYGVTTGRGTREDFAEAGLDQKRILNSIADLPGVLS